MGGSASKNPEASRITRAWRYPLLCIAAFCSVLALIWIWRLSPPYQTRELAAAAVEVPSVDDFWLSYYGDHLDHVWLYHGLNKKAVRNLEAADVVFAGSSVSAFAFSQKDLQVHLGNRGWSFFQMSFAADGAPAALDMIRRYDLHPRVLIVMDDRFFKNPSAYWKRNRALSQFDAAKFCWSAMLDFSVKRVFHRVVPAVHNLVTKTLLIGEDFVIFRSVTDGTWRITPPIERKPFNRDNDFQPAAYDDNVFSSARIFMEEMKQRNIKVLFTWALNPLSRAADSARLAKTVNAPWVVPEPSELATYDGYHMTPEGAARFSELFFKKALPWLEIWLYSKGDR